MRKPVQIGVIGTGAYMGGCQKAKGAKVVAIGGHSEMEVIAIPEEYRYPQQQSFIDLLSGKEDPRQLRLADGVYLQHVFEALMASASEDKWVKAESSGMNFNASPAQGRRFSCLRPCRSVC